MIEQQQPSHETVAHSSWWLRAAVFCFTWSYRLVLTAVVLAAMIVAFAQTDLARDIMRRQVLALVNDQLEGTVACDDLRIDIFRGIVLVHPVLSAHGTTVFEADELSLSYDIAALFAKTVAVNELAIRNPRIAILRSRDGVWNINRIARPSADTTTTPPPDLVVRVREVSIRDGAITVYDSTDASVDSVHLDMTHTHIDHFNLDASIWMSLPTREYRVSIDECSLVEQRPNGLDVRELELAAVLTPAGLDVQFLKLRTAGSSLHLAARIDGVDILREGLSSAVLDTHPAIATIQADQVSGEEVSYIVPDIEVIDSYALDARVAFRGDALEVRDLTLRAGDGIVRGDVILTELSGNRGPLLNIRVVNSAARYADVRRRLVFVPLPELPFLTTTRIDTVTLRGYPADSLFFIVHGSDAPGRVDGRMTLKLDDPAFGYDLDMRVSNGDLSVFADSSIATTLNGRVVLRGRGTDLATLDGTYHVDLERSRAMGRPIRALSLNIAADGTGIIDIDSSFVDVTPFRTDTIIEEDVWDAQTLEVHGRWSVADVHHPQYSLRVSMNAINLASLLRDRSFPTRLTTRLELDGEGIELDSILGVATARVDEFALADRALRPFTLRIASVREGALRSWTAQSQFLQASVEGQFMPSAFINVVSASVINSMNAVEHQLRHITSDLGQVQAMGVRGENMDARFQITLRDATPVNLFLDSLSLIANLRVEGRVQSTVEKTTLTIDTIAVREFALLAPDLRVTVDPLYASMSCVLADLTTTPRVEQLNLQAQCDDAIRVNDTRISNINIAVQTTDTVARMRGRADVNGIYAGLGGQIRWADDSTFASFDSLHVLVDSVRGLEWRSLRPVRLRARDAKLAIDDLAIQRGAAEVITASGEVSTAAFTNARVVVTNLNLADVPRFVVLDKGHPVTYLDGFMEQLTVTLNGTWEQPEIALEMQATGVRYNDELIGTLTTQLRHRDRDITGWLRIANPALSTQSRTLDLAINHLPIDLGLRGVEQRLVDDRPIDIDMRANKLALAAVEPFLPAIERLQGVADGVITVKGTTPDKIDLGGNARFAKATFLSSATNIVYSADGVMHLDGSELHLDTIVVRNLDRDRKRGIAYANGVVVFDGLSVSSMDFTVRSPGILVMNKGSQARSPKVFGDVIIAAGVNGLAPIRFYGKLDAPKLEGDIQVLYADIVFPQERSTTKSRYTAFQYQRSTDSSRRFSSVLDAAAPVMRLASDSSTSVTSTAQAAIEQVVKTTTAAFVDLLRYDLNVYLKGRTIMTMVFGMMEILIADLEPVDQKVPLVFTGRFLDNSTNLRGRVRVKEGTSTYKFYKPFLASGTLDFTAGGISNPSLDLKAVYRDRRTLNSGEQEDFRVEVAISGTKQKPVTRWSVYRRDRKQEGDSAKITGDALMLILLNKTQDELVSSGQGNLVGEVNGAMSAMATSALGDILSGIGGIVQSTQIDLGSDLNQSRLTVSGQLWSDVTYRLTGQISDFAGNSTFTITVPFTVLSDAEAMRYFMLDVSRSVNNSGNITRFQRLWEIKLGARLP